MYFKTIYLTYLNHVWKDLKKKKKKKSSAQQLNYFYVDFVDGKLTINQSDYGILISSSVDWQMSVIYWNYVNFGTRYQHQTVHSQPKQQTVCVLLIIYEGFVSDKTANHRSHFHYSILKWQYRWYKSEYCANLLLNIFIPILLKHFIRVCSVPAQEEYL